MANPQYISWLDYTINNNPNGIMKVLSDNGYSGYMAPQSLEQMRSSALELMDTHGDEGIKALMKAHPEYSAFKDLFSEQLQLNSFSNATGNSLSEKINAFVYKNPVNQALFALGIFCLGYIVINKIKKS